MNSFQEAPLLCLPSARNRILFTETSQVLFRLSANALRHVTYVYPFLHLETCSRPTQLDDFLSSSRGSGTA